MKEQGGHWHAWSAYGSTTLKHFVMLGVSLVVVFLRRGRSLTTHLPLEIQHPRYFPNLAKGIRLIRFGEQLKTWLGVKLYWENAPLLTYGTWSLKCGQTEWELVPADLELCLDVGHVMLGARNIGRARRRILRVLRDRARQIKHVHIHENDLIHDRHQKPRRVLTSRLLREVTVGRSFIFEK